MSCTLRPPERLKSAVQAAGQPGGQVPGCQLKAPEQMQAGGVVSEQVALARQQQAPTHGLGWHRPTIQTPAQALGVTSVHWAVAGSQHAPWQASGPQVPGCQLKAPPEQLQAGGVVSEQAPLVRQQQAPTHGLGWQMPTIQTPAQALGVTSVHWIVTGSQHAPWQASGPQVPGCQLKAPPEQLQAGGVVSEQVPLARQQHAPTHGLGSHRPTIQTPAQALGVTSVHWIVTGSQHAPWQASGPQVPTCQLKGPPEQLQAVTVVSEQVPLARQQHAAGQGLEVQATPWFHAPEQSASEVMEQVPFVQHAKVQGFGEQDDPTPLKTRDVPAHPPASVAWHVPAAGVQHAPARAGQGFGEQLTPSPRNVPLEAPHPDGWVAVHVKVVLLQQAPVVAPPHGLPEQLVPAPCQSPPTVLQAESVRRVQEVPTQHAPACARASGAQSSRAASTSTVMAAAERGSCARWFNIELGRSGGSSLRQAHEHPAKYAARKSKMSCTELPVLSLVSAEVSPAKYEPRKSKMSCTDGGPPDLLKSARQHGAVAE
jgi:hypothetical protein